jgi:hypothetical protein
MAITKNIRKKKRNNSRRKIRGGVNGVEEPIQSYEATQTEQALQVAKARQQEAEINRAAARLKREEEERRKAASIDISPRQVIFIMSSMSDAVKKCVEQIIKTNSNYTIDVVFAMCPFNVKCYIGANGSRISSTETIKQGAIILQDIKKIVESQENKNSKFIPIDVPAPCFVPLIRDVINKNEIETKGGLLNAWPRFGPAGGASRFEKNMAIDKFKPEIIFDFVLYMYLTFLHNNAARNYFARCTQPVITVLNYVYNIDENPPNFLANFFKPIAERIKTDVKAIIANEEIVKDIIAKNIIAKKYSAPDTKRDYYPPEIYREVLELMIPARDPSGNILKDPSGNILKVTIKKIEELRTELYSMLEKFKTKVTQLRVIEDNVSREVKRALFELYNDSKYKHNLGKLRGDLESKDTFLNLAMIKSEKGPGITVIGDPLFKPLVANRVDGMIKIFSAPYKGAYIDVNFAVPLLGFHYKLLSMERTRIVINPAIQETIKLLDYTTIENPKDEGWALVNRDDDGKPIMNSAGRFTMPYKKFITTIDDENKLMTYINKNKETLQPQRLYEKIHCITDLESDDLLALKVLQPHFEYMELYLCENPRYTEFTTQIKNIILENDNKPDNVIINETNIENTNVNLEEIVKHLSIECFENIDTIYSDRLITLRNNTIQIFKEEKERAKQFIAEQKIIAEQKDSMQVTNDKLVAEITPSIAGGKKRKSKKLKKSKKTRKSRKSRK